MNYEEFLKKEEPVIEEEETPVPPEIDVQKAVVESLAADKAMQDETILALQAEKSKLQAELELAKSEKTKMLAEMTSMKSKLDEQNAALGKVGEVLAKNVEKPESTMITLLERSSELPDRFEGETRDHVLEVLKEAREAAEKDGRNRRAQILESVLCANEPCGMLAKKRAELEKLFNDNANLVNGPVIEALQALGLSYKNGEQYLLPSEILKRSY